MKRTRITVDPETFPAALQPLVKMGGVFDSSCSPEARVYYLEAEGGCFLKCGAKGSLKPEADMTRYFHSKGLGAQVLSYITADRDWLLTRQLPGEDCLHLRYFDDPKRLSETTGLILRALHETPFRDCPVTDRLETYYQNALSSTKFEPELFAGVWDFSCPEEARTVMEEGYRHLQPDTLVHGDYCLPNILLKDWRLSGFIDLGGAGVGDRHMDLVWGLWTLNFNFHTQQYFDRFLDAYGRERVDMDKLRTLAAMEILT